MPTKILRPYQVQDLAFYMKNPRCLNLSDPATGKTGSVCVYMEFLWTHKQIKTLWCMPKTIMNKNYHELLAFTNFRPEDICIIDGTPAERLEQIQKPAKVYIMGFKRMADDWATFKKYHPETDSVIVDEIHKAFKNINSKRTQNLLQAMRKLKIFLGMTGSLIDGKYETAYPSIHIIEPRYYYDYNAFKAQHAELDIFGNVIQWKNPEKIALILKKHSIRHTFEEIYGNQDPVILTELCDMHQKQRDAYDEFEETAILELEKYILDGTNPGVAAIRCTQIMGCPHQFDLMKPEELTGKEQSIYDHLEDHALKKEPLIIFAALQNEQKRILKIADGFGLRVALINGTISGKIRGEIDLAFQNGEIDVVVASQETADVGLNWGHVDHIIYASIDYKDSNFSQSYKRAIRGVRQKALRVTVLEYRNSIDQKKFAIVNRKSAMANAIDSTYKVLEIGKKVV